MRNDAAATVAGHLTAAVVVDPGRASGTRRAGWSGPER